jgi:hypothetical protein
LPSRYVVSRGTARNDEQRITIEPRTVADLEKLQGHLATKIIYLDPLEAEYRELQELRERVGKAEAAAALRNRHQA